MILLDATTKSLEVVLGGGASTQLPIVANWIDMSTTSTVAVSGVSDLTLVTNNTTAVTAVAAPASSTSRQVKFVSVRNVNSSAVTVKIQLNNNGTARILTVISLTQDETLVYIDGIGFQVFGWNGELKESSILINLTTQVTGVLPVANGGTGDSTLTAHGVLIGEGTSAVAVTSPGTSGQVLTSNGASADPTFQDSAASGTVTHTAGALTANQLVIGNGAADLKVLGSLGTTTTVLHGNAGGAPTFGAIVNADITNATIDLTTKVTGILPTANGGTGIAYFTASGPTTARTFTFPDANATVLTSNAAVTVAQGGTGLTTLTTAYGLVAAGTTATGNLQNVGTGTTGYTLTSGGSSALPTYVATGAPVVSALTDGATPALDASLGTVFTLAAAGDRTIAVPSNATNGQKIIIRHLASGGARTLALNTGAGGFRYGTDITGLTQTASGKTDYIGCIYSSIDSKWDVVAYTKGF